MKPRCGKLFVHAAIIHESEVAIVCNRAGRYALRRVRVSQI